LLNIFENNKRLSVISLSLNVGSARAFRAQITVRLLKHETPLSFDQICGRRTVQTSIWSLKKYGVSSSSESFQSRMHNIDDLMQSWLNCWSGTEQSIIDNAFDEWR